ncbi:MAG TPA: hypothetical protein VFE65_01140 [Pseudonocardia sp.]|jgi:hypothetical protein|nr:hypothetical protein [Pseudonocardia sp.]
MTGPLTHRSDGSMRTLARSDFIRAPLLATARPGGYQEWYHFVVYRPGWRLLLNFSLAGEVRQGGGYRLVPRVVVLVHDERWTGTVARFAETELDISADLGTLTMHGNRMTVGPDGYRLVISLPEQDISGELCLSPASRPFAVNNQPVGEGRLNWLFVPRLHADGWFRVGDRRQRLDGALAYHDHNWGRFRWGEDFGWEWGSVLPTDPEEPWSFVFMRMTDRGRRRCYSQALHVWRHHEPAGLFRHAALDVRAKGLLARPPDCTLPPPMRLVLGGVASDVPESIEITGERHGDRIRAQFRPESYAQVALPSETCLDRSVVLTETSGRARVTGVIDGADLDVTGVGVFELLHG